MAQEARPQRHPTDGEGRSIESPRRQAFLEACAPWTKIGLTDFFIRGYDDHQCGRHHAFLGATVSGDAYRAGWNAYGPTPPMDLSGCCAALAKAGGK